MEEGCGFGEKFGEGDGAGECELGGGKEETFESCVEGKSCA
jgi:hypothetical protein